MRVLPLAFLPLASCTTFFDSNDSESSGNGVQLRACNASGYDFAAIGYGDLQDVGPLANGECTDYVAPDHAVYRYDWVRFVVGSDEFEAFPIDFVGETPLTPGFWTYRLTISDYEARRFAIDAVAD